MSALESANSELESADSNADSAKVGVWVRAFTHHKEASFLIITPVFVNGINKKWSLYILMGHRTINLKAY